MRRWRGAFLCFDVDCDPGLEVHGEVVGEDGGFLDEQLGFGMSRILKAYDRSAFDLYEHFVVVSFPYPKGISPQATPQVENLDDMFVRILSFCTEPKSKKETFSALPASFSIPNLIR